MIARLPVTILDVEIGSMREAWRDAKAARVISRATLNVLRHYAPVKPVLFVGGVHFEPACRAVAIDANRTPPICFGHILANQWLRGAAYEDAAGVERLRSAARSITPKIETIVFHDSLRASVKRAAKQLAVELCIPSISHRRLRDG